MKRILIVDDDYNMRLMITTVLKSSGYETFEADNGEEALEIVKDKLPDFIISDVIMANMNGFMLREALKEDPKTAKIPFILMTGLAMNAGAWKADPQVEYIEKPFIMPDLIALMEKKFNKSEKHRTY